MRLLLHTKACDPEFYDDNEKMSLFEDVSPGTLDERITRSTMNASMDSYSTGIIPL